MSAYRHPSRSIGLSRTTVVMGSVLGAVLAVAACGSKGAGGAPPGIYCSVKAGVAPVCYGYSNLTPAEQAAVSQACTSALGGTIADTCPGGSVGCCTTTTSGYSTTECYYGGTASMLAEACKAANGMWSGGGEGGASAAGGSSSTQSGPSSSGPGASGTSASSGGMGAGASTSTSTTSGGTCSGSELLCPSGCADLDTDPKNCGSCEHACPGGPSGTVPACKGGKCAFGCASAGETFCNDLQACVNLSQGAPCTQGPGQCGQDAISDCGACGHNCPTSACGTATCTNGACGVIPDPSTNGNACYTSTEPGICEMGTCEPLLAYCYDSSFGYETPVGEGTYSSDFNQSQEVKCSCAGDTLQITYLAGSGPTMIPCGLCAKGPFSNLNAAVACFQAECSSPPCASSCTSDANCSGSTPVCDTLQDVCVQCVQDSDCATPPGGGCADAAHVYAGACAGETCSYAAGAACSNGCWSGACNGAGPSFDGDAWADDPSVVLDKETKSTPSQGYAPASTPIVVYVPVTLPNSETGVTLVYSASDFGSDNGTPIPCTLDMTSGNDDVWVATIPGQPPGTTVGFYYNATPRNGSGLIYLPGNFVNYTYVTN